MPNPPCELMRDIPLCGEQLIYEPIAVDLIGDAPPKIICKRRRGHPGSHYGEANRTAVWDDELIYEVSHDVAWSTFMPQGNYYGVRLPSV